MCLEASGPSLVLTVRKVTSAASACWGDRSLHVFLSPVRGPGQLSTGS